MEVKKANTIINNLLKENQIEIGIFISMLSYEYMKKYNISMDKFLLSLNNSLKILEKG